MPMQNDSFKEYIYCSRSWRNGTWAMLGIRLLAYRPSMGLPVKLPHRHCQEEHGGGDISARASELLRKLLSAGIIASVKGMGKGKYRFAPQTVE